MKRLAFFTLVIAMLFSFTSISTQVKAQPCQVSCTGPWIQVQETFTQNYNGCQLKFYLRYQYRPCMGAMQIQFLGCDCLGFTIESLTPGCSLHCADVPALYRMVYRHIINQLSSPILHASPSPCYYLGTIIVPPGAESCMGMTPGTTRYVTVPCATNGCCYSKLEPYGTDGLTQTVLSSTPCPPPPSTQPSTWNIQWSCDVLGGGFNTYTVNFTPDLPLSCQLLCASGTYTGTPVLKNDGTTGINKVDTKTIDGINVYPNPVQDNCTVEFMGKEDGQNVTIELTDISGKLINSVELMATEGKQQIQMDTKSLVPGTYTIRLISGENVYVKQIVK